MPSAILVLNGACEPPSIDRLRRIHGHCPDLRMGDGFPLSRPISTVAVDGGANLLAAAGILPQQLLGDLDSIAPATLESLAMQGCAIFQEDEQERNDLEKALDWMDREGIGSGVVCGFEGDRLDMQTGLYALLIHRSRPRLLLAGARQLVERIDVGFHELKLDKDQPFSLVSPLDTAELDLQGAKWELERHRLLPGCGAVSNIALEPTVHVATSRPLLLFRQAPWAQPRGDAAE